MSKFAIQTIAWGNASLDDIMRDVVAVGYDGIELFQHPEELGGMSRIVEACRDTRVMGKGTHVQLVGLSAGSFKERCALVKEYCALTGIRTNDQHEAPYVYCDEWKSSDLQFARALREGVRVALHPNMYKPVQTLREADEILTANPFLLFLPDTAHLTIAGDDPVDAIRWYATRLAAVHIKDWREEVGRSFHFYARGFCELGEGLIAFDAILDELARKSYQGWYVVEQDTTSTPRQSIEKNLMWLKREVSATSRRLMDPRFALQGL